MRGKRPRGGRRLETLEERTLLAASVTLDRVGDAADLAAVWGDFLTVAAALRQSGAAHFSEATAAHQELLRADLDRDGVVSVGDLRLPLAALRALPTGESPSRQGESPARALDATQVDAFFLGGAPSGEGENPVVRVQATMMTQDAGFGGLVDPIYFQNDTDLFYAPANAAPMLVDSGVSSYLGTGYLVGPAMHIFDTPAQAALLDENVKILNGAKYLKGQQLYDILAPTHKSLVAEGVTALQRLHFFKGDRLFSFAGPNRAEEITTGVTKLMVGERLLLKGADLFARSGNTVVAVDTMVSQVEGEYYLKGESLFFVNSANVGEAVASGVTRLLPGGRFFMVGSTLFGTLGNQAVQVDSNVTRVIADGRHYLKGTTLFSINENHQIALVLSGATAVSLDGLKIVRGRELFAKSSIGDDPSSIYLAPAGASIDLDYGGSYFVVGGELFRFTGAKSFVSVASGVTQVCHDGQTFLQGGRLNRVLADHSFEDLGAATMCLDHPFGEFMTEVRSVSADQVTIAWQEPRQERRGQHFIALREGAQAPVRCDAELMFTTPMISEFDNGLVTMGGLKANTHYSGRHCVAIQRPELAGSRYIASRQVFQGDVRSVGENLGIMIPDTGVPLRYEIEVNQTGTLEDLYLRFRIHHSFIGDLVVTLIGPQGQEAILADRSGGAGTILDVESGRGASFFDRSEFIGQSITGVWTVQVVDESEFDTGTLEIIDLRLFLDNQEDGQVVVADDATVSVPIKIDEVATIQDLQVGFELTHASAQDLDVALVHPDGTVAALHEIGFGGAGALQRTFGFRAEPHAGLADLAGKSSAGAWQLRIRDAVANGVGGTLQAASLTILKQNGTPDVYVTTGTPISFTTLPDGPAWQNQNHIEDVNNDDCISAADLLEIVRTLRDNESQPLPLPPTKDDANAPFLDVNGDGLVSTADLLLVVRYIRDNGTVCF